MILFIRTLSLILGLSVQIYFTQTRTDHCPKVSPSTLSMGNTSSAGMRLLSVGPSLLKDGMQSTTALKTMFQQSRQESNVGASTPVYLPKHPPPHGKSNMGRWSLRRTSTTISIPSGNACRRRRRPVEVDIHLLLVNPSITILGMVGERGEGVSPQRVAILPTTDLKCDPTHVDYVRTPNLRTKG